MAKKTAKTTTPTVANDVKTIETIQSKGAIAITKAQKAFETTVERLGKSISSDLASNIEKLEETKTEFQRHQNVMTLERQAHETTMTKRTEEVELEATETKEAAKIEATEMLADAKAKTATEVTNRKSEIKKLDDELEFNKKRTSRLFAESVAADEEDVVNAILAKRDLVTMTSDDQAAYENQAETIKATCEKEKNSAIGAATTALKHKQDLETRDLTAKYEKQITALETIEASKNSEIKRLENQIADFKAQQDSDNQIRLAEATNSTVTINQDSGSSKR